MQKKKKNEKDIIWDIASTKNISASREARNFLKKGKLIFIKKSLRWAQSGFCSFNRFEVTSKTINMYLKWLVQQGLFKSCEINSSSTRFIAARSHNGRAHNCWAVWHILEKTGWCDIHPRILSCVTYIAENWVVWHTLEKTGWYDIYGSILGCVTCIREIWVVWHKSDISGLCDI